MGIYQKLSQYFNLLNLLEITFLDGIIELLRSGSDK
jgi:hypothetical protein